MISVVEINCIPKHAHQYSYNKQKLHIAITDAIIVSHNLRWERSKKDKLNCFLTLKDFVKCAVRVQN